MTNKTGGLGILDVLGLIFVTLKLTGNIDWSWWIVLLPLFPLLILTFLFITLVISMVVDKLFSKLF